MDVAVVADASVWVSRFLPDDVNYQISRHWIERYVAEGGLLVAPAFLLVEVAASISRRKGQSALAREVVKELYYVSAIRILSLNSKLVWDAVEIGADLQMRAGDAIYVAIAYQNHIPLVSWDQEQLKKAEVLTTTYTPKDYPF